MPHRRPDLRLVRVVVCLFYLLALALPAAAQTPAPDPAQAGDSPQTPAPGSTETQTPAPEPTPPPPGPPPQTELNLINLPTTLSIRRHHSYFRLTHRFARDLGRGNFGDLAADGFATDQGAIIGLEYRFALFSNLQLGIHRSLLNKTIMTFGRWDALPQGDRSPIGVSLTVSYEGINNLRDKYIPAVAVTVSRTLSNWVALYATPGFAAKTHAADTIEGHDPSHGVGTDEHAGHSDTWFAGIGARIRFRPSAYVVAEYTPRIAGYDPNPDIWGIAVEKLTGGHTLQLNFTNSFNTTYGQIARGGIPDQVFLGFNITRKF
jgi:hypothetical protein